MTDHDWTVNWKTLAKELEEIKDDLCSFELVGESDFERLRLHVLTYGLVSKGSWLKMDYGRGIFLARKKTAIRDLWIDLADAVGAPKAPEFEPVLPRYLCGPRTDYLGIVSRAIARRTLSQEFILAWAQVVSLHRQYLVLIAVDDFTEDLIAQRISGACPASKEVHRCWYAHWVFRHAPSLKPNDRVQAGQDLAILCADIKKGKVLPWSPYPQEWFEKLLSKDADDLGDNFVKLGEEKLIELQNHPILTPDTLPPLTRDGFDQSR